MLEFLRRLVTEVATCTVPYVAAAKSGLAAMSKRTAVIEPAALLTPVAIASLDPTAASHTPRNPGREPPLGQHQHQTSQPHPYRAPANFEQFCCQNTHHVRVDARNFSCVSRTLSRLRSAKAQVN
jgi:hypothetical protein